MVSKMTFGHENCRYKFGVGVHKLFLLWTATDFSGQVDIILMLCFNIGISKYGHSCPHLCIWFFMNFCTRSLIAALNLYITTGPCPLKAKMIIFYGAVSHVYYTFLFLCVYLNNFCALASLYFLPFSIFHVVLYVMLFGEGGNCVLYLNVRTVYIMIK